MIRRLLLGAAAALLLAAPLYAANIALDGNLVVGGNVNTTGNAKFSVAAPAAAGTNQATATAMTADLNDVTGADGTKGVALPAATAGMKLYVINTNTSNVLKVYPVNGGSAAINSLSANAALGLLPGEALQFVAESATQWRVLGNRMARGQAATVTASDTIVTGLNTVVAVICNLDSAPTTDPEIATCSIGNQSGAPAAGSILVQTWKTFGGTPAAATTFSKNVNWTAIGN